MIEKSKKLFMKVFFGFGGRSQFLRYLVAGGTAVSADLVALYIFKGILGLPLLLSVAMAFVVGFSVSFVAQKFWTFTDKTYDRVHKQAGAHFGLTIVNFSVNMVFMHLLVTVLGVWYILAKALISGSMATISFFLYKYFIFKKRDVEVLSVSGGGGLKNGKRIGFFAIVVLTAVVYVPMFFYMDSLRKSQIENGWTPENSLPVYGSDSAGFVFLGNVFLETGKFSSSKTSYVPETFRTPGYPFVLAFWKNLFGSYRFFPLFQVLLVAVTACMIYFIGTKLFQAAVGAVAAVFFVLSPNTIFHSMVILSEVSYVFLLVLAVLLVFYDRKTKLSKEALIGLTLGAAVLVKPISLFLPLLLAIVYIFNQVRGGNSFRKTLSGAMIILLCFGVVLMPWLARNYSRAGAVGVSSVSSFNLFFYNVPEFLSFRDGISPDEGRMIMAEKASEIPSKEWAELKHGSVLAGIALDVIKDDPFGYAKFHAIKTIPFFLSSGLDNIFVSYNDIVGREVFIVSKANLTNLLARGDLPGLFGELKKSLPVTAEQFAWLALIVFGFLAFVFGRGKRFEAMFLLLVIFYFAVLTGPVAYSRFRLPAEPFILLLAVAGFFATIGVIWRKRLTIKR